MKKLFLCGFGRRARHHVAAMRAVEGIAVAGVFDTVSEMRAQAQLGGLIVFSDLQTGLRQTQPELALVCTPPNARRSIVETLAAFPGMRRIVVEKPLALSLEEAQAMLRVCEQHGVALTVGHQLRFADEFIELKRAACSGRLGEIQRMHANCFGKLFDQGSHLVDQFCWIMGDARVKWVDVTVCDDLAHLARLNRLPAGFHADAVHPGALWTHALLHFDNGTQATLECGVLDSMAQRELGPWLQKRIAITGTLGAAEAHVASHFREWSAGQPPQRAETNIVAYENALQRLYRAIVDPDSDRESALGGPQDQLHVMEIMHAIVESGRRRAPVEVGDATDTRATVAVSPQNGPAVSVIVPLRDHRGMGTKAIASWTLRQRCSQDDFELIVLSDKFSQDIESEVKTLLRPQDQLVRYDGVNEMEQYHHGATLARGEVLLFTEPHCIAEPEAIAELADYFRRKPVDAACGRSDPLCENNIALAERDMFDEGFVEWSKPGAWQKVILRAFAIRRRLYFDVGGYQYRYDRFSEWLLAATLHQRGHVLDYIPALGVKHLYGDSYPLFDNFIQEFTDGECKLRTDLNDSEFCFQYFGAPPEWNEARSLNPRIMRAGLRNLCRLLIRPQRASASVKGYLATCRQALYALPMVLLGGRILLWRWRARVMNAKLRFLFAFGSARRRARAFFDYYSDTTSLYRVRYALANKVADGDHPGFGTGIANIPSRYLFGFHPPENDHGVRFRWSGGLSGIHIPAPSGHYRVRLSMLGVRTIDPLRHAAFFLNRNLLTKIDVVADGREILIEIEPQHFDGSEPWLMMYVRPWRVARSRDARELGLAIQDIDVSAVVESMPDEVTPRVLAVPLS